MLRLVAVVLLLLAPAAPAVAAAAAGTGAVADSAGPPRPTRPARTAWVYDLPDLRPPALDAALDRLVARGVTRLFLSIEDGPRFRLDDPAGRAAVARAVGGAAARGVEVHAMLLQHPRWLDDPDGAARRATAAAAFGRGPGERPFAGLHLDVEPHTLEAWECGGPDGRARLLDRLADLARVVRAAARAVRPLPLSAAIPWWVLPWTDGAVRAAAYRLAEAADEVVLMAYGEPGGPLVGGHPDRLACRLGLPGLLDRLPGSTRLSVGLAGYEYPDSATLDANADRLDRRLALHPAYAGVVLFLDAAPPGTPLVVPIRGRVVGPDGRPLHGVTVTVRAAPAATGEPPAGASAPRSGQPWAGQPSGRRAGPRVGAAPPWPPGTPGPLPDSAEWTGSGAGGALPWTLERHALPRGDEAAGTSPPGRRPASPDEDQEGGADRPSAATTTNRCGRFVVRLPSAGAATLVAEAHGLRVAVELTGLVAGREREAGTLVLAQAAPARPEAGPTVPPDPALPPQAAPLAEARALALARRDAEAEAAYRAVLGRWPGELEARLGLARLAAWQGRHAEAAAAYRSILDERCDAVEALLGLADLARWQGRLDAAAQLYAEVAADWPHEPAGFLGLGRVALQAGRLEAARAQLARALALDPSDAEARRLLARAGGTP